MGYWGVVNNCIKNSDLILLILDARVPRETKNKEVLKKATQLEKEVIFVINKSDLISDSEKTRLMKIYEGAFFVSAKEKGGVKRLKRFLIEKGKGRDPSLRVAMIGYPNVGKSSILNLLVPNARARVSSVSGTTKETQWIRSGNLRFMDSPGVIPRSDSKIQVGITASKNPHKIRDPEKVAVRVINIIRRKDKSFLEKFYGIPINKSEKDYEVFLNIGEAKKLLIKGGEVDEHRTAIRIVDDWQKGKLGLK